MMQTLLCIIMTEVQKVAHEHSSHYTQNSQMDNLQDTFVIYGVGDLSPTKLHRKFKEVHDETS